jgi:hypothetical protein
MYFGEFALSGCNVTMILALNARNVVLSEAVVAFGLNTEIFKRFLFSFLRIFRTGEDFTIVIDNVHFHHLNEEIYDKYLYTTQNFQRYSPFLIPYEEVFSKIKSCIRKTSEPFG